MRYLALSAIIMSSALLYSCSKKDKNSNGSTDPFVCDIVSASFPAADSARVFIPNAFSPNGDGLNDRYRPFFQRVQSVEWSVYDENNNQLFTTTDSMASWAPFANFDGGIKLYHYKVKAVSKNGHTYGKCGTFCTFSCIPSGYNGVDTLVFPDQYDQNEPEGYLMPVSQEESATFFPCQ